MTIDITDLINGPRDTFEDRLEAFIRTHEKTHPHLFKPREERMTKRELLANQVFDSVEWHQALAAVQEEIGVTTGDWAALFFSGMEREWTESTLKERTILIEQYISEEEGETIL